ncbi:hypothetical protein A2763_04290 [Candidatus Kaiserbacteria bacterium RIFCSPHIGHO2_01_FULL_54_36]|uniref:DUF5615 domain-containing protein n=1 Tax=Candidatus Kaiserbacteria bacterium RIFCSPHIGHO2_01_FULL_54_36 TaxID=1798482 RepID=A0A1F6CM30_9BACT|nr:MAG: hypothetical protein A2763_04290 [Candidatus Kaiserbacteria bacterium RIFCSPHIGHO2_01_FULL_54_36]
MSLKLLCDENIAGAVARFLEEEGHDVARPVPRTPDEDIGVSVLREKRVIVTHDSDFANILKFDPRKLSGIIRIKIDPSLNHVVIASLRRVLAAYPTARRLRGRLIIALPDSFREWEGDKPLED